MRHYEDGALKLRHVREILRAIENFHFAFTAVASQRSSGGISFMYASSARNLDGAKAAKRPLILKELRRKLADKRPPFAEFAARFEELKYSSKFTKQKGIVRYILLKLYEANSPGLAFDPEKVTIEHLAPEHPTQSSGLSDEEVASIGNLILITEDINNKLANKSFEQKRAVLRDCKVWIDKEILTAKKWGAAEISKRTHS